jgi:hypothetical protein
VGLHAGSEAFIRMVAASQAQGILAGLRRSRQGNILRERTGIIEPGNPSSSPLSECDWQKGIMPSGAASHK